MHFQFLEKFIMQLIWTQEYLTHNKIHEHIKSQRDKRKSSSASTILSTSTIHDSIKRKKSNIIKMDRMDIDFPQQRDSSFLPTVTARVGVVCQLCNHFKDKNGRRIRTLKYE